MNWRLGAISISSGQSGQLRELTATLSRNGEPLLHELGQRTDERRVVVERLNAIQLEPELAGPLAGLDVEVPQDLQVVRDEADRRDEHLPHALRIKAIELLEHIGPQPRLAGRARALERERPALETG